jgi:mannosyltransferase
MLAVVALAFAARLYRLGEQSLWFDEIVTVVLARASWYDGLVGLLGQGIQLTPLFHWAVKLWLAVGDTEWLLRVPAMAFGVLTVPTVFKLGQFYFGDEVGLLAAFIFAINPYQVWYAQELRLYTLLTLAAAGAMIAFGQMLRTNGRRGLGALLLFNLLGFPTHYFMFLISMVQFLYLVMTLKQTYSLLRRWVVAQIVPVLVLVPWWLFIIHRQHFAVGIGWIPHPNWADPLLTLWNFSLGYTGELSVVIVLSLSLMALGLGIGLWQAWREPIRGRLMTLWLVFPPVITLLMSSGRLSFYVDRYLLIISPVLTVLTVGGLFSIRPRRLRWGLALAFAIATGLGLMHIYFDRANFTKDDWRAIARSVDTQAQADDMVITCTDGYRLAFEYYNPHHTLSAKDVMIASQLAGTEVLTSYPRGMLTYHAAWVIALHDRPPVHNLAKAFPPILDTTLLSPEAAAWERRNFRGEITVAGISAYRYDITDPLHLAEIAEWYCSHEDADLSHGDANLSHGDADLSHTPSEALRLPVSGK